MELEPRLGPRVTVERIRSLFGNVGPIRHKIWEAQFDGADDELRQLARTPWKDLFDKSFWVYFHDLRYVELQPEVFAYLFPACLTMAQQRLMAGRHGIGAGDSDFLATLAARHWTTACVPAQIEGTYRILVDGFMDRLDRQEGFGDLVLEGEIDDPVSRYNWIGRINSLGHILPSIEPLWTGWWELGSPGKAIAAVEYAWSLVAPDDTDEGILPLEGGPHVEPDAGIYGRGWESASLGFLASTPRSRLPRREGWPGG